MCADGTFLGSFLGLYDMAAVAALPLDGRGFLEYLAGFHVAQKFQVSSFVVSFHGRNSTERGSYLSKALAHRGLGETWV